MISSTDEKQKDYSTGAIYVNAIDWIYKIYSQPYLPNCIRLSAQEAVKDLLTGYYSFLLRSGVTESQIINFGEIKEIIKRNMIGKDYSIFDRMLNESYDVLILASKQYESIKDNSETPTV